MQSDLLDLRTHTLSDKTLTSSWVSIVLRECSLSERWEARSSRSLMGMALHIATMNTTGARKQEAERNSKHGRFQAVMYGLLLLLLLLLDFL